MTAPRRSAQILGRAQTIGDAASPGVDDSLEPARAVRRALADAGRKAIDVDVLVVASGWVRSEEALRAFARRSLGPQGGTVGLRQVVPSEPSAEAAANEALATLEGRPAAGTAVAIVIGIGADGTTVALCVGAEP